MQESQQSIDSNQQTTKKVMNIGFRKETFFLIVWMILNRFWACCSKQKLLPMLNGKAHSNHRYAPAA
jgi:hypothetical protein